MSQTAQTGLSDRVLPIENEGDLKSLRGDTTRGIFLGMDNPSRDDAIAAGEAWLKANEGYKGSVAVLTNSHGVLNAAMNKITGGNHDPAQMALAGKLVDALLKNAGGRSVAFIAHSDGTSTLDRVLGNMGKTLSQYSNLSIHYYGSPQLWSAAAHSVNWTVRRGDPVTWLGSAWRIGRDDTKRIGGWGHSFVGYMNDAGGI